MRSVSRLTIGVCAVAVLAGSLRPAAAVSLRASFTPIRVTARPGQVLTTAYELKVDDGEPTAHFKVEVQDWWRSEDGQQSFYAAAGSLSRSCGNWVTINPRESAVAGGDSLHVRLSISVPADVKPGGYWCALSVDEQPDPLAPANDAVAVKFLASVSTGIYVNVNPIERAVDITSIDLVDDHLLARVTNTGNAPVAVEGRFEFLEPERRQQVATVALPRNVLLTEPVVTGSYAVLLPDAVALPSGRYVVRLVLDIGLDHYIAVQRLLEIKRATSAAALAR
jgi:hypothetical protein